MQGKNEESHDVSSIRSPELNIASVYKDPCPLLPLWGLHLVHFKPLAEEAEILLKSRHHWYGGDQLGSREPLYCQ